MAEAAVRPAGVLAEMMVERVAALVPVAGPMEDRAALAVLLEDRLAGTLSMTKESRSVSR